MGVVLHLLAGRVMFGRSDPLYVCDTERATNSLVCDRAREPADGDQPAQSGFARFEIEYRNGILRAIANKELFTAVIKCERIRLGSKKIGGVLTRPDGFDDF